MVSSVGSGVPYEHKTTFNDDKILFKITQDSSMGPPNQGILMFMHEKKVLNNDNVSVIVEIVKAIPLNECKIILEIIECSARHCQENTLDIFERIKDFSLDQLSVLQKMNHLGCDFSSYIEHIGSFSDKLCKSVLDLLEELFSDNILFEEPDGMPIGHLFMAETEVNLADVLSIFQVLSGFSEDQVDKFTLNVKNYFLKTPDILNTPNIFPFNALILAKYPRCEFDFNKLNQMREFQLQAFLKGIVNVNSEDRLDNLFDEIMSRARFSFTEEESSEVVPSQPTPVHSLVEPEFNFDPSNFEGSSDLIEPFSLADKV